VAVHTPNRLDNMHMRPVRRRGQLSTRLTSALVAILLCQWVVQGHASESYCQKKAESLGWAVGCGCLKYDLSRVQENISRLLPECSQFRLASSLAVGLDESVHHDEHDFLCMLSCHSTDWREINQLIGRKYGHPI
jgi:hypothetical protein